MRAKAARLHGAEDIRIDEFELPAIRDDEILVKIVCDSICMSTYKMAKLGTAHKRVHEDVADHPAILGHELAGDIVEVGAKYADKYQPGMRFTIQPAINYKGSMDSPGYSYEFCGGDATYCIIPAEVFEVNCFLQYKGEAYYDAALAEPLSCSIGAVNAMYHTKMGDYNHMMGIKEGGKLAVVAGGGPMGLGAVTYILNRDRRPGMLVVTDIDQGRLDRAAELFPPKEYAEKGIDVRFINTKDMADPAAELREISGGTGFDDVLCYAPIPAVYEQAVDILGRDGCLNFFAGPADTKLKGLTNLYDIHYNSTHIMGTTGGNTDDMIESLDLTEQGCIYPGVMVTHIGGLTSVPEAVLNLPNIPGGKKLIYTHTNMPLTAIDALRERASELSDDRYNKLADLVDAHNGLWNLEAEQYVLENFIEE